LEDQRKASEATAFHTMLFEAMGRVDAEAAWARINYSQAFMATTGASLNAFVVRQCITKGAFAELRAACVRQGGDLTGEFLDLEREIDSFASRCEDPPSQGAYGVMIKEGKHAGLNEQLASIQRNAGALRQKAAARI
jgi:hypothetical protein